MLSQKGSMYLWEPDLVTILFSICEERTKRYLNSPTLFQNFPWSDASSFHPSYYKISTELLSSRRPS